MKVLARRVSSHPKDTHFWKKYKEIHLISNNFMGKQAFWMASFQYLSETSQNVKRHKHLTSKSGTRLYGHLLISDTCSVFSKSTYTYQKAQATLLTKVSHFSL